MKKNKGFTLVELMIVMAVIAVLATMALFGFARAQAAARDAGRQNIMNGIQVALEGYFGDNGHYGVKTTATDFCATITMLTGSGHLASAPNDPKTKAAICGTGNPTPTGSGATYTFLGATQTTCGQANCWQSYTLTLAKESGGSSVFKNPQ